MCWGHKLVCALGRRVSLEFKFVGMMRGIPQNSKCLAIQQNEFLIDLASRFGAFSCVQSGLSVLACAKGKKGVAYANCAHRSATF
jgi:hypothetical protein